MGEAGASLYRGINSICLLVGWVCASQILAAALDAGSTRCSCSMFGGASFSLASLRPVEAFDQISPTARSCHSRRAPDRLQRTTHFPLAAL